MANLSIDEKSKIFQDYVKGQKCVICTFEIELLEDIMECEGGYCHGECLADEIEKESYQNNEKLEL